MRVLVSGYYGFRNCGDEAILAGMIRTFHELDPTVSFTVISGTAAHTRSLHGVAEVISRNQLGQIWNAVGRSDLVVSGGGSLLQDVTGLRSIPYYLGIVAMARLRRRRTMLYAQGIGPVRRPLNRALIRAVVNRVQLITVRDEESRQLLHRIGVTAPPISVTADAALALPPGDRRAGLELLAAQGVALNGRPLLGICVRPWSLDQTYLGTLAKALDQLSTGPLNPLPVLIPMQYPHDVEAARSLAQRMVTHAHVLTAELDYRQALDAIAGCDAILGMRYHALVFAAMAGVPTVGISYDPKNDNFLRLLGQSPAGRLGNLETTAIAAAVERALAGGSETALKAQAAMPLLAAQARQNARLALELAAGKVHGD